jgi:hypothetical protein
MPVYFVGYTAFVLVFTRSVFGEEFFDKAMNQSDRLCSLSSLLLCIFTQENSANLKVCAFR